MKSFDEWINENGFNFRPEQYNLYKYLYEAEQKSRQAEVDGLQKRIDEINKLVDLWREDYITLVKYDDGNRYCLEDCINRVVDILKGNSHES